MPRGNDRLRFDDVERLIQRSRAGSAAEALLERVGTSIERSRIVDGLRATLWAGVRREERPRIAAIFVLSAAIGEAILTRFVPAASAPALPPLLWLLVAAVAAVPAIAPQAVTAAWDNWKRRY